MGGHFVAPLFNWSERASSGVEAGPAGALAAAPAVDGLRAESDVPAARASSWCRVPGPRVSPPPHHRAWSTSGVPAEPEVVAPGSLEAAVRAPPEALVAAPPGVL